MKWKTRRRFNRWLRKFSAELQTLLLIQIFQNQSHKHSIWTIFERHLHPSNTHTYSARNLLHKHRQIKIQARINIKSKKCMSHFAYELRDWNFKFARTWLNRHESATLILSHLWSWYIIFSMNIFLDVWFAPLWCYYHDAMPMQSEKINMNARYMTSTVHCKNLSLSCQVWTLGKLLHDEPFFMPWAKQRPPAHARPIFITILTRLDKLLAYVHMKCIYMTRQLHDVRSI